MMNEDQNMAKNDATNKQNHHHSINTSNLQDNTENRHQQEMEEEDEQEFEQNEFSSSRRSSFQHTISKFSNFFSKTINQISTTVPAESLEMNFRIFQQKVKETFNGKEFHVTEDESTAESIDALEDMTTFYTQYEQLLTTQIQAMDKLKEAEEQLAMFYSQVGHQMAKDDPIGKILLYLGEFYRSVREKESLALCNAIGTLLKDVYTFKSKALQDTLDTFEHQQNCQDELDAVAGRYFDVIKKINKRKSAQSSPISSPTRNNAPTADNEKGNTDIVNLTGNETVDLSVEPILRKQFEKTKEQFQLAKAKYETINQALVEKAGVLATKQRIDLQQQLLKLSATHYKTVEDVFYNKPSIADINDLASTVQELSLLQTTAITSPFQGKVVGGDRSLAVSGNSIHPHSKQLHSNNSLDNLVVKK